MMNDTTASALVADYIALAQYVASHGACAHITSDGVCIGIYWWDSADADNVMHVEWSAPKRTWTAVRSELGY